MKASDIDSAFNCGIDSAKLAIKIMCGQVELEDQERFPVTYSWIQQCYNRPREVELKLSCLNELLQAHGVEALESSEYIGSYCSWIRASYLNVGDAYITTILFDHKKERFSLTSYGDFIEANEGEINDYGEPIMFDA